MNNYLESIYYKDKNHRNHKIPKVYYKQWINTNEISEKNPSLNVYIREKNKVIPIGISDFTVENDAFIIKFGDTFLPNIVKEHFNKITSKYEFIINGKEVNDIENLSLTYSEVDNKDIKIFYNGVEAREQFNNEISSERCCCIENGLNDFYENNFESIIEEVKYRCCNSENNIELTDNVLLNLKKLYLSFYLRSDASLFLVKKSYYDMKETADFLIQNYSLINKEYPNIKEIINFLNMFKNTPIDEKKLFMDLRREYLWFMMFEPEKFVYLLHKVISRINLLYPCIHINKSKQKFYTSDLPIVNNEKNVFMILTPKLLLEYIPNINEKLIGKNVLFVDDNFPEEMVEYINKSIKNNANMTVLI